MTNLDKVIEYLHYLLKDKIEAKGKKREEAIMLLNHKAALKAIVEQSAYFMDLSLAWMEDVHSVLIEELGVERNLRHIRVGISGTRYRPLEVESQIREAVEGMCVLVNGKSDPYEKALLTLLPFPAWSVQRASTARVEASREPAVKGSSITGASPAVDGSRDDGAWAAAAPRPFVHAMDRISPEARHSGEVRGVWSDDGITLGFRFEEPDVSAMPTGVDVDDHKAQDLVNVFATDPSLDKGPVFRLRFDADGRLSVFDGSMLKPACGARVAVRKAEGCWSAELFVPFSLFGGRPARLSGNVSRWRPGRDGEWTRLSTRFSPLNSDRNAFVPIIMRD